MSRTSSTEAIATLRIDIGKSVFHLIGLNRGPPFFCAKSDLWPPLVAPYRPAALLNRSQARRRSASSGATAQREWPPRTADPGDLRAPLCKRSKERVAISTG